MLPAPLRNRKIWLGAALAVVVLAALWPLPEEGDATHRSATAPARSARAKTRKPINSESISFSPLTAKPGSELSKNVGDLFPVLTWTPPPPPAPPSQPVAPPLPFSYGGRYIEGQNIWVFLLAGEQMHKVRIGDTVLGTYRIDKIESTAITMTYLPLATPQQLPVEGANP